jgi:uncharacterized membrane protein YdbT with pleckstrin-like domain
MEKKSFFHLKEIKDGEKVIKTVHRHWFDILQQLALVILIMAALIIGLAIFPALFVNLQTRNFYALFVFLETTFALFIWIYAFFIWIDYYFDIWIITSERIINTEQKGLFTRQVSELKFAKIQDVTADVSGFFQTILNYGDVHVQTAGEEERFFFRQVPDPYGLKNLIMDLQKKHESDKVNELGEAIKEINEETNS